MIHSAPHGFRRWRRTRPFWGGLFAVLGGLELIMIPLAPMPVTVHQGMAGVASWLIGALLITAGALLWFQPAQRTFFGVLAVLLALASFLTSNFGGFFAGLLLGVLGGALGFAWSPAAGRDEAPPQVRDATGAWNAPRGGRLTALAVPLALPGFLGLHFPAPAPTPPPSLAAPTPTPSPTPSAPAKDAGAGPRVYLGAATLRASSLTMSGLSYDGVARLPSAAGTVEALKFSMSEAVLKDVDQVAGRGGVASRTATGSLALNGHVVMYTTKMSAKLLGVPVTFTPAHPPPLTLPHMVMTDVVSERPSVRADGAAIDGLDISTPA
ncbi:DUF6114 domain-containing protein [Actinomadura algeriensis]|uniref:Uncharacterized protein n=1 Tax=Actinomadura algeriensis TaxID=1679523 RepID=A0ABR9JL55_9ACTN|nr:DUF6114 domain-containing protein [Actinomadura algeriensis]MBE1531287.1 hypothetical protein [Actinomadura algeriensis]